MKNIAGILQRSRVNINSLCPRSSCASGTVLFPCSHRGLALGRVLLPAGDSTIRAVCWHRAGLAGAAPDS